MFKKLARSIREFKKYAILAPICVAFEVLLEVTLPFLMAAMLDYGIKPGNMAEIGKYGLLLILCAAVSLFFGMACGVTSSRAAMGFARNLRHVQHRQHRHPPDDGREQLPDGLYDHHARAGARPHDDGLRADLLLQHQRADHLDLPGRGARAGLRPLHADESRSPHL